MPKNPSELPWTPAETEELVSYASVVAELRDKVERGTADDQEKKRFAKAVFALKNTLEEKERPASQVIIAETKDGKKIEFNLAEIREQWDAFFRKHHLGAVADLLPQKISLTPAQIETLKKKVKEGYTRAILVPAGVEKYLQKLKENLTDGYEQDAQGNAIETYLSNNVRPDFPNKIETTDPMRVGKAYLILTNPDEPLLPGSKNKTADQLIAELQAGGLSGLTLADFLIEERAHFEKTGKHLIDGSKEATWLLASRDSASRVLRAGWSPDNHQVRVGSYPSGNRSPDLGARSSVVFSLEPLP